MNERQVWVALEEAREMQRAAVAAHDTEALARALWAEAALLWGLCLVYRRALEDRCEN